MGNDNDLFNEKLDQTGSWEIGSNLMLEFYNPDEDL
jgi:hypothetical protein